MAFSIRTRLTFWYVTLLTVSLMAFGSAFSYSLFRIFTDRMDNQISSVANMMVHTVIRPSGELFLPRDFDLILGRFFGIRTEGNYIQVLDPAGGVIAQSSTLEEHTLPISDETYRLALSGETSYANVSGAFRYPVRVVTKPIVFKEKGLVAIVQVGSSLEGLDDIFHSLAYIFLLGIAASVVIASVMGWFLARQALKPVRELAGLARKISAENLNERLNIAVPNDELGALASTINEMIGRLEASFKQIRQFTGDASHELKTPLTILKGEMEMAIRSRDDVEYMREVIASSLEEIDRMSYIVRNLLDLARMDAGGGAVSMDRVSLDHLLSERFEHFRKFALDSRVDMVIIKNMAVMVTGDGLRLGQLLYNLIDNAIKYTPGGGRVELSVEPDGAFARVTVRDTGIGISKEDLPYIFDRFYRVDKARSSGREVGGAGLGLSICKEIVDAHKGTIEAASEPGKGTAFTVRLPV
ncbi:MAG: HAMP domain-containing protein [Deltaproteobacteria bacterium]|nr:HAMP domain-containing protein [Deltaproteobacteria bacterium]